MSPEFCRCGVKRCRGAFSQFEQGVDMACELTWRVHLLLVLHLGSAPLGKKNDLFKYTSCWADAPQQKMSQMQ
jgi:hypothetical protein